MYIIITHVDPDGWASEFIVRKYLEQTDQTSTIVKFNWNYGGDTSRIEDFIEKNKSYIKDIFMTDLTLPDSFMEKYAPLITWLDHHLSNVDREASWKSNLKSNASKTRLPDKFPDYKLISACELTWAYFFPNLPVPPMVSAIGRHDVWDNDGKVEKLHDYIATLFDNNSTFSTAFEGMILAESLDTILPEAVKLSDYKRIIERCECKRKAKKVIAFGEVVGICERVKNSMFFDELCQNNPDIDYLVEFDFNFKTRLWTVGCYSAKDKDSNALGFLSKIKDRVTAVSFGGHKGACGLSFPENEIGIFLNLFTYVPEER